MTTETKFTREDVVTHVRRIAAENPDYVYERIQNDEGDWVCQYVADGEGSCLLGKSLLASGADKDTLIRFDTDFFGQSFSISHVLHLLSCAPDTESTEWLLKVQKSQDRKIPWGESVALADTDE